MSKLEEKDLVYAAYARCPCGAGMAYASGLKYWDCSEILLGRADVGQKHQAQLPFAFYEIKSENQPSANRCSTRPDKAMPDE